MAMHLEVAVLDSNGQRSTIHGFDEVVGFDHIRVADDNNRVYITMENGKETLVGGGYGLDVLGADIE